MTLTVQTKADPRSNWNTIKEGLYAILENAPDDLDWRPADLLDCLIRGTAELTLFFWEGEYAGFYVTRKLVEEFRRRPYLFLWLIYKDKRHDFDLFQEVWPHLRDEAKKHRAAYVSGWSPRDGWGRRMGKYWMTIYRRDIQDGRR